MSAVAAASLRRKSAWPVVQLSQVCTFKPPKSICRKQLADDTEVSFVPMNDLGEITKYFEPRDTRPFGEVVKSYTYFADHDVLCAKITPCFENGKLGIARGLKNATGFGSSEFVVMRASDALLPEFLYYFLARDAFRAAGVRVMSGAVGHKRVPNEYFEGLAIPLPPLEEQKRIVAVLDQAFAALDRARANAEANLADAETLRRRGAEQLLRRYAARAPKLLLGELADFRNGLNFSRHSSGETVKVAGVGNFQSNFWVPQEELAFATIDGQLPDSDKLCAGDILAVRSNGNKDLVGRVMVMGDVDGVVSYSGFVIRIRLTTGKLDPRFLCYYMKSGEAVAHLRAGGGGANISNLNQRVLSSLTVPVLTHEEQRAFIDSMTLLNTNVDALIEHAESKLTDLAALRQSLLQKAFAGELT